MACFKSGLILSKIIPFVIRARRPRPDLFGLLELDLVIHSKLPLTNKLDTEQAPLLAGWAALMRRPATQVS